MVFLVKDTCLFVLYLIYFSLEVLSSLPVNCWISKKHLKNVGPICHCEPPHAHSPGVAIVARAHRCPRRQQ